ncbi:hypothetical protein T492DRAFT_166833, partial [Pavlovales sp. CCMP2436]
DSRTLPDSLPDSCAAVRALGPLLVHQDAAVRISAAGALGALLDATVASVSADTGDADTGAADTGDAYTGAADTGAADTGAARTGAAHTGAAHTGAAHTGATDTGATHTGAADTGGADTGAADTGVPVSAPPLTTRALLNAKGVPGPGPGPHPVDSGRDPASTVAAAAAAAAALSALWPLLLTEQDTGALSALQVGWTSALSLLVRADGSSAAAAIHVRAELPA